MTAAKSSARLRAGRLQNSTFGNETGLHTGHDDMSGPPGLSTLGEGERNNEFGIGPQHQHPGRVRETLNTRAGANEVQVQQATSHTLRHR